MKDASGLPPRLLFLGTDLDILGELLDPEAHDQGLDVFSTTNFDRAVDELIQSDIRCVIFDNPVETEWVSILSKIGSLTGNPTMVRCDSATSEAAPSEDIPTLDRTVTKDPSGGFTESIHSLCQSDENEANITSPLLESLHWTKGPHSLTGISFDGTYQWANERMASLLGGTTESIPGDTIADRTPPGINGSLKTLIDRIERTGYPQWIQGPKDSEGPSYFLAPIASDQLLLGTPSPAPTLGFGSSYIDQLRDIFFIVDANAELIFWNTRLNEVTGYSDVELVNRTAFDLFPSDERAEAQEKLHQVTIEGDETAEFALETKSGERIPYQFSGSLVDWSPGDVPLICGIGRDISHRVTIQQELESTIAELEDSNRDLERFASVASHDMREPLRMIRSYLQLFERRYINELDDDAADFINYTTDGAERLQRMIEDLLTYSRVGNQTKSERVDCGAVIHDVRENLKLSIEESDAQIVTEDLPPVRGDRSLIVQLFQNLIENAISHADSGQPKVYVTARERKNEWVFAIQDESGGLPTTDTDSLFEMFQSQNADDGLGIGLATCRKIVETFDGEIWVDSDPGVGSTFYFSLPATDSSEDAVRVGV